MQIYLDANATTPVLPEVVAAMQPFWTERFGNPSSAHAGGQRTRAAVERARAAVAALLGCTAREIVFTSGGTEGDNLALAGVLQPFLDRHEPAHLVTTAIEHHAVLYAAEALERRGLEVTYLAPDRTGVVTPEALAAALRPHTRLVSIMLANNETGAIQPLPALARVAKKRGILVHTDAVQAVGKLPLALSGSPDAGLRDEDVHDAGLHAEGLGDASLCDAGLSDVDLRDVDLLTLSGHKMYAPQGTGALFVRKGVALAPLFHGGPHERQRRAGTENVPGIVGLGCAATQAGAFLQSTAVAALRTRRDRLEAALLAQIPGAHVNAAAAPRMSNTTNLRVDGLDAERLLIALDLQGIAASFGAACQSGATEPSHVLLAMGFTPAEARSSLRLSLSRLTDDAEIDRVIEVLPAIVARMRSVAAQKPTLSRTIVRA